MKICPNDIGKARPWVPRSQVQMVMTAHEVEIDNYCREVLKILNKATPQNLDSLLDKMATLSLDNEYHINKLVYYIVRKAEDEPLYSEVYAEMCCTLNQIIDRSICSISTPQSSLDANVPCGLFKTLLIAECQVAFNRIFATECHATTNNMILRSYRQKMFGTITFIGRLYNVDLINEDTFCVLMNRLLSEEDKILLEFQVECMCKLLYIVGLRMECQKKRKHEMDQYFLKIDKIHHENNFCSRVKFALLDLLDLRQNKWISRKLLETPKTLDEIRSAYMENAAVNTRRRKKKLKD